MTNLAATSSPHKPNWNETKEKIKQKFSDLTDDDLFYLNGKKEEMLNKIQIKLGKTKEELTDIIGAL
ncbi:MAG: general stress protein CsbD [Bacteroidota bacterium]|nr:general stress protein CsbD [Bacteroidota bacterium]MDP3144044.1 general stress protein CsbD [Bacteroidota bacterium]